jgi:cellulose synthase/poly-beta-1,6-N-acetylglucosamine synthase-like glycosyltransferase
MEPVKNQPLGWHKVIFTHVVIIGVPTIIYYYLRLNGKDLFALHATVASVYVVTALMMIYETSSALFRRYAGRPGEPTSDADRLFQRVKTALGVSGANLPAPRKPVPPCSLIVAAYLPNEQHIIVETIQHLLSKVDRPAAGFEVILAYNSPVELPVEDVLRRMAQTDPALKLLRVRESESKAENLNAAMDAATGEVIGILDADHHLYPDCLARAWRWLESGYDVVQGRNIIRNFDENVMTRIIAVEFECVYGVSHPAKSLFVDTGIFGGSNGYWRADVLRRVRFDPHALTEDIDASSRALLLGYRIMHDRSIISTEFAPTEFRSFWFQRKRWSQGWLEVSLRYQRRFWTSNKLNIWQKLYWTYLLYYREIYPPITLQIFPIVFSLLLYQGSLPLKAHWYLWATAIITLLSGPYQTVVASKNAIQKYPIGYAITYALIVFFYAILKNMISIVAIYDHLLGRTDWVVTRRKMTEQIKRQEDAP